MMKKQTKHSNLKARRGSAIIICLSVMSLLLIVCMVFSFESRNSVISSTGNVDRAKGRLLEKSNINRVVSMLKREFGHGENNSRVPNGDFMQSAQAFYTVDSGGSTNWANRRYVIFGQYGSSLTQLPPSADTSVLFRGNFFFDTNAGNILPILPTDDFPDNATVNPYWISIYVTNQNFLGIPNYDTELIGLSSFTIEDRTGLINLYADYADTDIIYERLLNFPSATKATLNTDTGLGSLYSVGNELKSSFNSISDTQNIALYVNPYSVATPEQFVVIPSSGSDAPIVRNRININSFTDSTPNEIYNFLLTGDTNLTDPSTEGFSPWLQHLLDKGQINVTKMEEIYTLAGQATVNIKEWTDRDNSATWVGNVLADGTFTATELLLNDSSLVAGYNKIVIGENDRFYLAQIDVIPTLTMTSPGPPAFQADVTAGVEVALFAPGNRVVGDIDSVVVEANIKYAFNVASGGNPDISNEPSTDFTFTLTSSNFTDNSAGLFTTNFSGSPVSGTASGTSVIGASTSDFDVTVQTIEIKSVTINYSTGSNSESIIYPNNGPSTLASIDPGGGTPPKEISGSLSQDYQAGIYANLSSVDDLSQQYTLVDDAPIFLKKDLAIGSSLSKETGQTAWSDGIYNSIDFTGTDLTTWSDLAKIPSGLRRINSDTDLCGRSIRLWTGKDDSDDQSESGILAMFKINDETESWGRFNPNSYIVHPSDANLTPVNLFLEAATPTGRTITSWDVDLQNDITASPFKNRGRLMDYIGVANTADDASVLADIDRLIANLEVRNNYMHLISTIYTVKDWATNPLKTNDPNYFQHDMDKDGVYESHAVLDYLNRSLIVIHRDTFTDSITILDRIPIYED